MSDSLPQNGIVPSPLLVRLVEAVCDRFEAAWRSGPRPHIELYLGAVEHSVQAALLRELLTLDVEYRRQAGEDPIPSEYLARFPSDTEVIEDAFVAPPALTPVDPIEDGPGVSETYLRVVEESTSLAAGQASTNVPPPSPRDSSGTPLIGDPLHSPAEPELPAIPGYQILSRLGAGGMGVVYKAWQEGLKRYVALKVLKGESSARAELVNQFRFEAEAVARLNHPNIVQVYHTGSHDGCLYLVMELVEGGGLDKTLAGAPQPPPRAASLVATLARAIHAAHRHERPIIHRDLKPSNVLLTTDGTPKISDFGLARPLEAQPGQASYGPVVGTPEYMAPEQALGRVKDTGPATDVYALTTILYEMLAGRPPFRGDTVLGTLEQVCFRDPVPVRQLQPGVPRDLETICLKGLQKHPARRYASALALAEDLRRFLDGEPIKARPVSVAEKAVKWARRKPAQAALAATVLLAVLGGVAGALYYQHEKAAALAHRLERQETIARLWDQGLKAEENGQLEYAREHWGKALALIDDEPDARLEGLRGLITERLEKVRRQQEDWAAREDLKGRIAKFRKHREQVAAHEVSVTDRDLGPNCALICREAPAALAELKLNGEPGGSLKPYRGLFASDQQMAQVAAECYQVLLAWAEAEAAPLPGQADAERAARAKQALRRLDAAEALAREHQLRTPQAFHVRRARYLAQAGDEAAPRAAEKEAAGMQPQTALDHFLSALESYRQKKFEAAASACAVVLGLEPDHHWAQYLQGLCYLQTRRWGEAKVALTACLGHLPDSPWPRLLRASAHSQLEDFPAAEEDFKQVLSQAKDDPAVRAVALISRSVSRISQKRWDDALEDLRQAVKLPGDAYQAYVTLAQLHEMRQEWEPAVEALGQALARHADDAGLHHLRARLHLKLEDRQAARKEFEQAIALWPKGSHSKELAGAHVELAELKCVDGDPEGALKDCDAALEVQPDYGPAYRQRAKALLALNRDAAAGKVLEDFLAVARGKATADIHLARGLIHARLGEHAQAVESFTQAFLLKPDDAATLSYRGWSYLRLEALKPALEDFEAALKLDNKNIDALCGRGLVRVRLAPVGETVAVRALLDQVAQGVQDAEQALGRGQPDARLLLTAACIHARVVARLESNGRGPDLRRAGETALREQLRRSRERAVDLLREALTKVPPAERKDFWKKNVESEPALAAVRADLTQLAQRYGR
jgi:tetratricopeptide (TPR) repeat protein